MANSKAIYRYVTRIPPRQHVDGSVAAAVMNATQTWQLAGVEGHLAGRTSCSNKSCQMPDLSQLLFMPQVCKRWIPSWVHRSRIHDLQKAKSEYALQASASLLLLLMLTATAAKVAQSLMTCDIESGLAMTE